MQRAQAHGSLNQVRAHRTRGFGAPRALVPTAFEFEPAPRAPVVLIAEDDDEFRKLVSAQLRSQGYRVIECSDGRELARRIDAYRDDRRLPGIDLAICDVYLPGISGLELVERMHRERLDIPVVLLSAFGDLHTCVLAANRGASAFFPKPVELKRLLSTVRALIWKPS